jgi:hypothetical protein
MKIKSKGQLKKTNEFKTDTETGLGAQKNKTQISDFFLASFLMRFFIICATFSESVKKV